MEYMKDWKKMILEVKMVVKVYSIVKNGVVCSGLSSVKLAWGCWGVWWKGGLALLELLDYIYQK